MKKTLLVLLILAATVLSAGCVGNQTPDSNFNTEIIDFEKYPYEVILSTERTEVRNYNCDEYVAIVRLFSWSGIDDEYPQAEIQYVLLKDYDSEQSIESDANALIAAFPLGGFIDGHVVELISVWGDVEGVDFVREVGEL